MVNDTDLRVIKTKCNIEQTFLALLAEKSFEKITVQNILNRALISKGTFYTHFADKFELAEKISEKFLKNFQEEIHERVENFFEKKSRKFLLESLFNSLEKTIPPLMLLKKVRTEKIDIERDMKKIIAEEYKNFLEKSEIKIENPEFRSQIMTILMFGFISLQTEKIFDFNIENYISEINSISTEYLTFMKDFK